MIMIYTLPLVGFCTVVLYKVVKKIPLLQKVKLFFSANCAPVHNQQNNAVRDLEANVELPDRIIHADAYLDTY